MTIFVWAVQRLLDRWSITSHHKYTSHEAALNMLSSAQHAQQRSTCSAALNMLSSAQHAQQRSTCSAESEYKYSVPALTYVN